MDMGTDAEAACRTEVEDSVEEEDIRHTEDPRSAVEVADTWDIPYWEEVVRIQDVDSADTQEEASVGNPLQPPRDRAEEAASFLVEDRSHKEGGVVPEENHGVVAKQQQPQLVELRRDEEAGHGDQDLCLSHRKDRHLCYLPDVGVWAMVYPILRSLFFQQWINRKK
jgi:hypothetical protein